MQNFKRSNRCVEVLEYLIKQHIEMFEKNLEPNHFISRDECLFLWVPLLKLAIKSYGYGAFIRHIPNDNKLVDRLQQLSEILLERLLIDETIFKKSFSDKISEMENQIKDENEAIYLYISNKTNEYKADKES